MLMFSVEMHNDAEPNIHEGGNSVSKASQRHYVEASVEKRPRNRKSELRFDWSLTSTALLSNGFLFSGKYVSLQIVDDEDIEIMFNAFEQQNNVDIIELYVHKSSAGSSLGTAVDTGIMSSDIVEVDDDDVVVNHVLLSVTNVEQGQRPPWTDAAHYTHINWLHPDEEDILGEDLHDSWNVGDALYKGLQFDTKEDLKNVLIQYSMRTHQTYHVVESKRMVGSDPSLRINLIQERICSQYEYKISYRKAWKAKQKAIVRVYGD
ncbi:hypothetical protein VNO78_34399 [Psophocarpus tetragonolobus]|uniref:Uncharacterized protein n=1 Tax=Psophocarpus tetragonolobus TaxID=3891 RepID=A0AAN9NUS5_PSOTE